MKRQIKRVLLASVAVTCWLCGHRETQAQQKSPLFDQVVAATWHTDYSGIQTTTVSGGRREASFTARVVQRANGERSVLVISPDRRAGELQVDDGSYTWHYQPQRRAVEVRPSESARQSRQETHRQQPPMTSIGSDTVAGRPVNLYSVTPLHPQAPELHLWVDRATLVPLRTDWVGKNGRHFSQQFSQLDFGSHPVERFHWPRGALLRLKSSTAGGGSGPEVLVDLPLALPRSLPGGALFEGLSLRELAGRKTIVLRIRHGRRQATLFETPGTSGGDIPQRGVVDNWNLGPLNITLVGDLALPMRIRLKGSLRIIHLPGE